MRLPSLQNILHTGDMRWHARMARHPALRARRIDLLFLDTTYASPQHVFPSQVRLLAPVKSAVQRLPPEDAVQQCGRDKVAAGDP